MEQREIDNMLLSMIQKHFPSLPLSDEYTDWGKWLGFARAVYESGRASPASAPEGWKIVPVEPTGEMVDAGMRFIGTADKFRAMLAAAQTPPVSEDWKDAERYRVLKSGDFSVEQFVSSSYGWKFVPMEELDAAIDAAMQEDKP